MSLRTIWRGMKYRCAKDPNYAGRGIAVCDRWAQSYDAFAADMGPRPGPDYSVERLDNDRGYEPTNRRWATRDEQWLNRRGVYVRRSGVVVRLARPQDAPTSKMGRLSFLLCDTERGDEVMIE